MEKAYILVHGFGGSLDEVIYLSNYLSSRGLSVYTPLLKGHGSTKKAMRATKYTDWIETVESLICEISPCYDTITLIGFSMGGLICSYLSHYEKVDKLVLINTPVLVWNVPVIAKDIVAAIKEGKSDKLDYYSKSIKRVAIKSTMDFIKIVTLSVRNFKNVTKKTLIVQCEDDETVIPKSAFYIKKRLGQYAFLRMYKGGRHQILLHEKPLRDEICRDICSFVV